MSAHDSSQRAVVRAAAALLALWALSWGLSYVAMGRWSLVAALAIAVVKGALVVLVFMELLHVRASVRVAAASAIAMFSILLGLVVIDVVARGLAGP